MIDLELVSKLGVWTRDWLNQLRRHHRMVEEAQYRPGIYRPYVKEHFYFADDLNQERYKQSNLFPTAHHKNLVICVSGISGTKDASVLMTDCIPDLHYNGDTQCFPLYWYEEVNKDEEALPGLEQESEFIRHDGITDFILKRFRSEYGKKVTREDIFYFVYGLLHSPEYRTKFAADLRRMLPRLPVVSEAAYLKFRDAGRKLAALHLNYETVEPWSLDEINGCTKSVDYRVEQMCWNKVDKQVRKDIICYNSTLALAGIPAKAYEYVVNGKSALEWLMERYAVVTDKKSGIVKDPNLWCKEHNDPQYIVELVKRIVRVSVETVDIVNALPKLEE